MKILKFNAIWCSGCIVMKNVMKEVEKLYPNIEIESYDYDMDTDMVNKWNVGNIIPVLIFLDDAGNEVNRLNGEKSKKEIIKVIESMVA
ncbi:MAG: thioredoxin family protein [Bacilli bacterium]|nr:thioredoxin family protein [Bacilli bacterium]